MRGLLSLLLFKWGRVGEKGEEGDGEAGGGGEERSCDELSVGRESVVFGLGVMIVVCV